ncbi:HEL155Cp [Eremothecium sinecaudum]|uniref:HEL155Cp n=1 Tax=Eremothecium sinecaudum TaxID=45286 RepID=A0A0X8HTE8_9SACH|nr:HEL155Cp [Eremothecium sinecaudum]AMD21126.1 HEL155Cp [Eremothecium sinecaudum]
MTSQGTFLDNYAAKDNDSLRSKMLSIASLMSGNSSTNSISSKEKERFGLRKLARSYLKAANRTERTMNKTENQDNSDISVAPYTKKMLIGKIHTKSGTKIYLDTNKSRESLLIRKHHSHEKSDEDASSVPQLKYDGDYDPVLGKLQINSSSEDEDSEWLESGLQDRCLVVIRDFPTGTGLKSVLNQVQGGALKNITVQYRKESSQLKTVELEFQCPEDAQHFMEYGRHSVFQINGVHLRPRWGTQSLSENFEASINHATQKDSLNVYSPSSRCLLLKKQGSRNPKHSSCHYPSPRSHICDLNIQELKKDFGQFGNILDISPMISRKLCVQINFFDIKSAMDALQSYKCSNSPLNRKYADSWTIGYGKDITDKPCVHV